MEIKKLITDLESKKVTLSRALEYAGLNINENYLRDNMKLLYIKESPKIKYRVGCGPIITDPITFNVWDSKYKLCIKAASPTEYDTIVYTMKGSVLVMKESIKEIIEYFYNKKEGKHPIFAGPYEELGINLEDLIGMCKQQKCNLIVQRKKNK